MVIRRLTPSDDIDHVSRVYARSWKAAYQGIVPQEYLDSSRKTLPSCGWPAKGRKSSAHPPTAPPGMGLCPVGGRSSPFTFSQNFIAGELAQNCLKLPWSRWFLWDTATSTCGYWRTTILPGGFTRKTASNAMGMPSATPSAARNCGRSGISSIWGNR